MPQTCRMIAAVDWSVATPWILAGTGWIVAVVLWRLTPWRDERSAARRRDAGERAQNADLLARSLPPVTDMLTAHLAASAKDPPETDPARIAVKVGGRLRGFHGAVDEHGRVFRKGGVHDAIEALDLEAWSGYFGDLEGRNAEPLEPVVDRLHDLEQRLLKLQRQLEKELRGR